MNNLDHKKLGKYLLDLQRYREGKLLNSNYFSSNTNTHSMQSFITCFFLNSSVTNVDNQQSSMDAPTPSLSLTQAEIQRTHRRPWVLSFKTTKCYTSQIHKIRSRELLRLETNVRTFLYFWIEGNVDTLWSPTHLWETWMKIDHYVCILVFYTIASSCKFFSSFFLSITHKRFVYGWLDTHPFIVYLLSHWPSWPK